MPTTHTRSHSHQILSSPSTQPRRPTAVASPPHRSSPSKLPAAAAPQPRLGHGAPRPENPGQCSRPPSIFLFMFCSSSRFVSNPAGRCPCRIRHDRKRGALTLPVFTSKPLAQALPAPTPASFCILQWSSTRSSALRAPSCLLCRVDKHPLVVDCMQCNSSCKPSQVGLSSPVTRAAGAVAMAPRKPLRHQCLACDLPCTESGPDAPSRPPRVNPHQIRQVPSALRSSPTN